MGFSITSAAVTVTVATFDTLAFCDMKLTQFSHISEEPLTTKAPENTLWIRKATFVFCFGCKAMLQDGAVASKGKKKKPKTFVSKYNF